MILFASLGLKINFLYEHLFINYCFEYREYVYVRFLNHFTRLMRQIAMELKEWHIAIIKGKTN